ncbi:T9SS C-terminal target domain-containing protein [Flavobacterium crocinum]|uniref:T9SS C-terminal target domain-containing protein n=1 Tax=Flavobacterium crocinum TaxID=2183896 RepID=A0A2S1YPL6_9FLAO|nr:T9SS type A sorting domain-containing protein [Flavobacterium crocinum]AWK05952.1 T9SS C-terminal target domain-containing protein [Flavobacterium crocinum]
MMKNYLILLILCFFSSLNAQIINFPDPNFKQRLVSIDRASNKAKDKFGNYTAVDLNGNREIEVSEAENLISLDVSTGNILNYITSLEGISNFKNLVTLNCSMNSIANLDIRSLTVLMNLNCSNNKITSLNVSGLLALQDIDCAYNELQYLDVSNLTGLKILSCYKNKLSSINLDGCSELFNLNVELNELTVLDLSTITKLDRLECASNELSSLNFDKCPKLGYLSCEKNFLTTLNLSHLKRLMSLKCDYNDALVSIFVKNGYTGGGSLTFNYCPNLEYICIDENSISRVQTLIKQYNYTKCNVNSYCTFVPGVEFYTIQGNNKLDLYNDGCDASDPYMSSLKYSISNGTVTEDLFPNNTGSYNIAVQAGTYIITPVLENPDYFKVSPASLKFTLSATNNLNVQDFCVSLKSPKPDLEIIILPLEVARPGFDVSYKIIYKNKGNVIQSGDVIFSFDDAILDLLIAKPQVYSKKENLLSWNFVDLRPLETREIFVNLNLNSPTETPPVVNNDIVKINVSINSSQIDATPKDNSFTVSQTVVGSFDPNDKTCLEGSVITPLLIGDYVHFLIRFENTGTYFAENVVIKDLIDLSRLDISTLVPTGASHDFITKISDKNKVEFIFENINLPFDDANNDGYIAFKIKTLPNLKVGDSFTNEANIYFDYNFPILTNKTLSVFKTTLGTQDFTFDEYFKIYPNPVRDFLNIESKNDMLKESVNVYNVLGQLVLAIPIAGNTTKIDVSKFQSGTYFLQVKSLKGTSAVKFVKI